MATQVGWQIAGRSPRVSFVAAYLVTAWAIFAVFVAVDFSDRRTLADPFGFTIPSDIGGVPGALSRLPVAPFVNAGVAQIIYVTVLLLVVGRRLERDIGPWRVAAVFVGSTWLAALAATALLHGLEWSHPAALSDVVDDAWLRNWNGGSAGCYGLIGWAAARAPRHRLGIVVLVLVYESLLTAAHLRSFTPAFHVGAFACGWLVGSWQRSSRPLPLHPAISSARLPPSTDGTPQRPAAGEDQALPSLAVRR